MVLLIAVLNKIKIKLMTLCQIDQSTGTWNEPIVPGKNEINFRGALLDK